MPIHIVFPPAGTALGTQFTAYGTYELTTSGPDKNKPDRANQIAAQRTISIECVLKNPMGDVHATGRTVWGSNTWQSDFSDVRPADNLYLVATLTIGSGKPQSSLPINRLSVPTNLKLGITASPISGGLYSPGGLFGIGDFIDRFESIILQDGVVLQTITHLKLQTYSTGPAKKWRLLQQHAVPPLGMAQRQSHVLVAEESADDILRTTSVILAEV